MHHLRLIFFWNVLAYSLLFPLFAYSQSNYQYQWQTGSEALGLPQFNPQDVAVDSKGNIYVTDGGSPRIHKYNSNGTLISKFGTITSDNGNILSPEKITIDEQDHLYVAEGSSIQKYDSNGNLLLKFGSYGSADGQFINTRDLIVDGQGHIYVVDANNNRVQKFDRNGNFLLKFGSMGSYDGQFVSPEGIAADSQGNVFVSDNGQIQIFTSDGIFISKFGSYGSQNGQFSEPKGIAIDNQGNIFVTDVYNGRIQKFNNRGIFLSTFGREGFEDGQFKHPRGVTVDNQGNIYVADQLNGRIQKFDSNGNFLFKFGSYSQDGQFSKPKGVTVDKQGNIYVADHFNHRIQKFDSNGNFLLKFGTQGYGDGQLTHPESVTTDKEGNVYVVEGYHLVAGPNIHRIQKFDNNGNFLFKFGSLGVEDGQLRFPDGIVVDEQGNIYVADGNNHRIQKFNQNGDFLLKFGSKGSAEGQFLNPKGVTLDREGNIYVADYNNHRIQKFDSHGNFLLKFGIKGSAPGEFDNPTDITLDEQSNIYVSDYNNHRIQKFTSTGIFLEQIGSFGFGNGQFWNPDGVTVDHQGNVYLADSYNNRIQKFKSMLCPSFTFEPNILVNGTVGSPYWVSVKGAPLGYSYSATGLPDGLIISTTGVISGTPTMATVPTASVTVYASNGTCSQSISLLLVVNKGNATIIISDSLHSYDGVAKTIKVTTVPEGLSTIITFSGLSTLPTQAGSYPVEVTINSSNYQGSGSSTLTIDKASQTITFTPLTAKTYGDAALELSASATSNLPVSFQVVSGPILLNGNTLSITGAGGATIKAYQEGNANYNSASAVEQSFVINKAAQYITFAPIGNISLEDGSINLQAISTSHLAVSFAIVSGPAVVSGLTLTPTGSGEVVVKASHQGDMNYLAAEDVIQSFCIAPAKPLISLNGNTLHSNSSTNNQWYLDGKVIKDATGPTLLTSAAGEYKVSVKNPCGGEVFSDAFIISVSAIEAAFSASVKLYPNPARVQLQIELPVALAWHWVKVSTLSGQEIMTKTNNGTNTIILSVSSLKQGFYILEVQTRKGVIQKKFLVN